MKYNMIRLIYLYVIAKKIFRAAALENCFQRLWYTYIEPMVKTLWYP